MLATKSTTAVFLPRAFVYDIGYLVIAGGGGGDSSWGGAGGGAGGYRSSYASETSGGGASAQAVFSESEIGRAHV